MSNVDETVDGTISPSGRFARMEAALDRIENKLDLKADTARVDALQHEIDAMQRLIQDAMSGRTTTPQATEYLRRFTLMETSISELKQIDSNRQAVADAIKDTADSRYRALLWVVGLVTVFNVVIALASLLLPNHDVALAFLSMFQ